MPDISVRRLDEDVVRGLRRRAERHGISMEEEVRRILARAVWTPENIGDLAVELFSPAWGDEEFSLPEREVEPPVDLDGDSE
ncbi:MAG: FitA-like ribbon-helix-helix domain-containing protein [Wenzhouxiangellaceae bacterium]